MNEQEFDFEAEFTTDEDVEEMLDNLVTTIKSHVSTDKNSVTTTNPYRVQQLIYTYKLMRYLTRETGAEVTYSMHEPYANTGAVSVTGTNLTITNTKWFMKAVSLASNFEVYPKIDGTFQMNFGFYGLTMPIEEV